MKVIEYWVVLQGRSAELTFSTEDAATTFTKGEKGGVRRRTLVLYDSSEECKEINSKEYKDKALAALDPKVKQALGLAL